jgi:hypothetical protein
MIDWWNTLSLAMKILWAVTLSASLIFIIQTILTFLGADADSADFDINSDMDLDTGGADVDASTGHSSGIGLLSFRNLVNFCLGFGWTAILLSGQVQSTTLLLIIAVLVGIGLVTLVMLMFKWISGMQQSGNINVYKSAVDCQGTVYIPIPAERSGSGKVQISINDSIREYDAVTDGPALKTGAKIRVIDVVSATTLLVGEIDSIIV